MKEKEKAIEYLMKNKDIYSFDDGTYKAIDIALKAYKERVEEVIDELSRKYGDQIDLTLLKQKLEELK